MIFNKELLDKIEKKKSVSNNILNVVARNRDRCANVIQQMNQIFDALPESTKTNKNLISRLSSPTEETFRGAFAEIVTNYIFKKFGFETNCEPKIKTADGIVTPDFYAYKKNRAFISEVFAPSKTKEQLQEDYNLNKARELLLGVTSKCRISLFGIPKPDNSGGFKGLGKEIVKFLEDKNPDKSKVHTLTTKSGASISFRFYERSSHDSCIMTGWHTGKAYTNKFHEKILESLREKRKAYKFPFVASCVIMPDIFDADRNTFFRALVGDQQIMIPVVPPGSGNPPEKEPFSTNSYTGFWGFNHPEFHRHHLVQAVLVTYIRWDESGKMKFVVELYENPHFLTDLKKDLDGVPDLLRFQEIESVDKENAYVFLP